MSIDTIPLDDIQVMSTTRIFPETNVTSNVPCSVPLSIIDATVATFAATAGTWIYDQPEGEQGKLALSVDHLALSLRKTLDAYPQWAGQLKWAVYRPDGDHTERFGRLVLSYGASTDPGVALVIARSSQVLASIVPSAQDRKENNGFYDIKGLSRVTFMTSDVPLVLRQDHDNPPCFIVQITTFACGGVSISVKMAHAIADARTMINFMNDWANVNLAIVNGTTPPHLNPVFNPSLLDNAAAGDIHDSKPNQNLIDIAESLPLHRYDWWASADHCPPALAGETKIPQELEHTTIEPFGTPLPWKTWDLSSPVSDYLIHFSGEEIHSMWEEGSAQISPARISHLDALLSHLWAAINRAKGLEDDQEDVSLDVTFDFRTRVVPPLSSKFTGSPITLASVTMDGAASCSMSLGKRAARIRSTLNQINTTTVPALLHYYIHQVCPQRLWNTFLGLRNILFTSWLRQNVYGIDFGAGLSPRYVQPLMPSIDGCLQVMEAEGSISKDASHTTGHWYEKGVSVRLHLESNAMEKLLKDPLLRAYNKQ
jgi:Transferase family